MIKDTSNLMKIIGFVCLLFIFSTISFGQTTSIKVYFGNEKLSADGCDGKVYSVTRKIPKTKAVAKASLDELFKGVTEKEAQQGFVSFFSEETKDLVISVKIVKGIAYVNLKNDVIQKLGNATTSCGGNIYDASVNKTLKQFPAIKKVVFAIEKDPALYYEWMQIGECPKELKNCSNKNF